MQRDDTLRANSFKSCVDDKIAGGHGDELTQIGKRQVISAPRYEAYQINGDFAAIRVPEGSAGG